MTEEIRKPACGRCWSFHRQCMAYSMSGSCKTCTQHVRYGRVSDPFPHSIIRFSIPDGIVPHISIDTDVLDTDTWNLIFTASDGLEKLLTFESSGLFSTANRVLILLLDEQIRRGFSAELSDRDDSSQLVAAAILAGGYISCYCSIAETSDLLEVVMDGHLQSSSDGGNHLAGSFKRLLLIRLGELIEDLMSSIRDQKTDEGDIEHSMRVYAATIVLHREVNQFQKSLRQGALQSLIPDTVPRELLDWLISLESELADYACDGCGKHLSWTSPIKGSMRNFCRHKRGEMLKLSVKVQQNRRGYLDLGPHPESDLESFFGDTHDASPRERTEPQPLLPSSPKRFSRSFSDGTCDPRLYHHQTPANNFSVSPSQVPESFFPEKEYDFGQLPSSHFFDEMDLNDPHGNDVYMASQAPEHSVHSNWMDFQGPYY
ncbi:hypothetical protein DL98DRAFT_587798 [Cadophora sp. DSE1049]|nr:hypothetical protein DL98DRAFT_587798 [Cadophora sp. DSE1049]